MQFQYGLAVGGLRGVSGLFETELKIWHLVRQAHFSWFSSTNAPMVEVKKEMFSVSKIRAGPLRSGTLLFAR
jgi:hypothetical protein